MPTTDPPLKEESTATLPFFALTLGLMAALQLPGLLSMRGIIAAPTEPLMPLFGLGMFTPLIATVVVLKLEKNPVGRAAFWTRARHWRVHIGWYALALFGFWALYVLGATIANLAFPERSIPLAYLPENGQHIAGLIMVPLLEETGWRGFALPRLQRRFGALPAALILGIVWSTWHAALFLSVTQDVTYLAISHVNIIVGSVLFSWLFLRTGQSLLIAFVIHAGVHLNNPAHAPADDALPMLVYTVAIAVAAVGVVVFDRARWRTRGDTSSPPF